jgi:hypothetical protein
MRHCAMGRHRRYRSRTPFLPALLGVIAALALFLGAGTLTGTFASASAIVVPARVLADRGAENPAYVMNDSEIKTQLAQIAVTARMAAAAHAAAVLAAHTYTVRSGDSISAVAEKRCGQARYWTGIYAASRAHRWTAADANALTAGQHLYLSCAYLPSMLRYAPAPPPPPPAPVATVAAVSTAGRGYAAPARSYASTGSGSGNVNPASYSGYQSCVVARESGGQSQVMNSSGHYGLYQFDYGTWVSGGGAGGDFGKASVAEQNRVFASVYAARGTQPWSPSDHC